jgi:hypothetical protein
MPAPISTTLKLAHGYSVDLTMDPEKGYSFDWKPSYPKFENDRAKRKFWTDYYKQRDAFLQGCADTWQMVVPLNAQDGLKFFRPGGSTEVHNVRADKLLLAIHYLGGRAIAYVPAGDITKMMEKISKQAESPQRIAEQVATDLAAGVYNDGRNLPGAFVARILWLGAHSSGAGAELIRRASEGGFYLECYLSIEGGGLRLILERGVESMGSLLDKVEEARKS